MSIHSTARSRPREAASMSKRSQAALTAVLWPGARSSDLITGVTSSKVSVSARPGSSGARSRAIVVTQNSGQAELLCCPSSAARRTTVTNAGKLPGSERGDVSGCSRWWMVTGDGGRELGFSTLDSILSNISAVFRTLAGSDLQ